MIKPAPPRKVLDHIMPYQPGKPISEVQRELGLTDVIKLASNENHLGAAPSAKSKLHGAIDEIHLYPDGGAFELKNALSDFYGFDAEQIILGNGSTEIVEQICEAYLDNGDNAVTGWPAFFKYKISIRMMGAEPIEVPLKDFAHDLDAMYDAIDEKTKIVFIADPNNPTGTLVDKSKLEEFIQKVPEHIVIVLDQAYYEFIPPEKRIDIKKFIDEGRNLLVLRTFSKMYGLAGLRIGYGFARPELVIAMNKVREAFNVNSLAQIAASAALQDTQFVQDTLKMNAEAIKIMQDGFDKLGLKHAPTCTNFVLVDWGKEGRDVFQALLKRGVIIRPMYGYDLPTYGRVSTSFAKDMEYFIGQLGEVLK